MHGAIGFTFEHNLHFLTRRLWAWRDEFGKDSEWQILLGRHPVSDDTSPMLGLRMPLKPEDRLAAPAYDEEVEPQPVGANNR